MYEEFETKTSYKYLKEVVNHLQDPVCILGGWAIFLQCTERFEEAQGRPYLGSRDIDLGFHMKGDLENSALDYALKSLKSLKFKPLGFRLFKDVHTETEEEIQEGQHIPAHFRFPMCVDPIVDNIPEGFKKHFGFDPIDEALLAFAFEDKKNTFVLEEFGKKLLLPSPALLLAMKLKSLPNRDKEHKRIKDICDIFALLWYSTLDFKKARNQVLDLISLEELEFAIKGVTREDLQKVSPQVNHSVEEVEKVVKGLLLIMEAENIFLKAIHDKKLLKVKINSNSKGMIVRKCVPFDFGPSRKFKDGKNRYHFWDIDSPDGSHNLSVLPEQIVEMEILDESFDPKDYVTWEPNWFIKRDWEKYS